MQALPLEARSAVTAALRSRRLLSSLLSALLVTATIYGWRTFWFLTDDAFISFRYISNHLNGWGYVWNPPPFRAVEGYSNLLWMIILEAIWRGLDIAPPAACNTLSLLFGLGTLALVWRIARRLELPRLFAADRDLWALLVVAGVVVNRTFLVWLSSGLETALFNFLILWWFSACLSFSRSPRPATLAPLVAAAALAALARPDGMLFAAASAAIALAAMVRARPLRPWLPALSPLLVVPLHLLWRFGTYGEWLPNTYYAKHREAWPLAGANYLASFCLEFAWWLFLIPPVLLLLRSWRGLLKPVILAEQVVPTMMLGTIVLHVSYFTFVIGGDLFEYRVYSYLVPLLFLSLLWTLGRLAATKIRLAAIFTTLIACTIPIPWVHHFETRDLTGLKNTHVMVRAVAPRFPWPLSIYVARFDALQAWLVPHYVGMRQEEHKAFYAHQAAVFPPRPDGRQAAAGPDQPVLAFDAVGVPGWVLPDVAIIDILGLNDRTIARYRGPSPDQNSRMAHDRVPPPHYVDCFQPNVRIVKRHVVIVPRAVALTQDRIRQCEDRFAQP